MRECGTASGRMSFPRPFAFPHALIPPLPHSRHSATIVNNTFVKLITFI